MSNKKTTELTDMQKNFLDALFMDETAGDVRQAMDLAGYSSNTRPGDVFNSLQDEIIERAKKFLSANSAKAVFALLNSMQNPDNSGVANRIKAAQEILNRAGVKETENNAESSQSGIVILPEKGTTINVQFDRNPDDNE